MARAKRGILLMRPFCRFCVVFSLQFLLHKQSPVFGFHFRNRCYPLGRKLYLQIAVRGAEERAVGERNVEGGCENRMRK